MVEKRLRMLGIFGIISLLSYTAMVVFSPLAYPGYDWLSMAVSDLSAEGAPSQALAEQLNAFFGPCALVSVMSVCVGVAGCRSKVLKAGIYCFAAMEWVCNVGYTLFPWVSGASSSHAQNVMHLIVTALVVILSLASLILAAIGAGKEQMRSLRVWAVICLLAMLIGPVGTALLPKAVFGLFERFSTFSAVVFNAVLGIFLMRGQFETPDLNSQREMNQLAINDLLKNFVTQSQKILGDNLIGIYLHGSAVMGCYNEKKSDIDLLVVVKEAIPNNKKHRFMDMVVELNTYAPPKGIELSIVKKEVCNPFVYPTPFELHFSNAHLEWYKTNPVDYIDKMKGTDKDLAAHFTIIYHRGKCLYGNDIKDVFGAVSKEDYFDSIWNDIKEAETEIMENPTYFILNLCRVLAYKKEELILSKQEGGKWGICNVPEKFHSLIARALDEYLSDKSTEWDENSAHEYAAYMVTQIKSTTVGGVKVR